MIPGARLTIDGCDCIVVRDAVADRMPPGDQDIEVLGSAGGRFFYARGEEVRRVRHEAPHARVVGMWHVLSASHALDDRALYVVYFDDDKNGRYFLNGADAVLAGEIYNGEPVGSFGHTIDLTQSREIVVDKTPLHLPARLSTRADGNRAPWGARAAAVAGIAMLAGAVGGAWWYEWTYAERRQAELETTRDLRTAIERTQTRLATLKSRRLGAWPEQSAGLHGFLALALRNVNFSARNQRMEQKEMTVTLNADAAQRTPMISAATEIPGVKIEHKADGTAHLFWETR